MDIKAIQLTAGDDIKLSLEKLPMEQNSKGYVLTIVGNLSQASFQCPGFSEPTVLKGNLEIISLSGFFSPSDSHLHLCLANEECNVFGGHLEPGTIVLKSASILFLDHKNDPHIKEDGKNELNPTQAKLDVAILENCPWSARVIRILKSNNIPHNIIEIQDTQSFEQIQTRSNSSTFPQLFIDGKYLGGYEEFSNLYRNDNLRSLL